MTRGASYQVGFRGGHAAGELPLRPDPPTRSADPTSPRPPASPLPASTWTRGPAPDVTVTRKTTSPGELLLDVIAARILTSAAAFPQDNPEQLANARAELRVSAAGPGDIIAALLDGIRWLPALSAV